MNTQKELAEYIGINETPNSWSECFEKAQVSMPQKIKWLEKDYLVKAINFYHLENELDLTKEIFSTAQIIKADEKLKQVSWILHYIMFMDTDNLIADIWNWGHSPEMFAILRNNVLPLIVLLSGYEYHIKKMKEKGFDIGQIENSINGVHESCLKDRDTLGLNGIRFSQMVWGAYFINTRLIKVGNLEYEIFKPDDDFVSKIQRLNKTYYCGNEIDCENNDNVFVKLHIPKQNKLDIIEVLKSLKNAKNEINKYYPQTKGKKIHFFCESWLLSKELDTFLSSESNILKFKNLFNTCEDKNNGKGFYKYLFNQTGIILDTQNLPEKTSLQKNVKNYIQNGNQLNDGYGLIKEDILEK